MIQPSNPMNPALHKINNEYTQRSSQESAVDSALKDLYIDFLSSSMLSGRAWNWDIQVLLKRQVLSRLIHYYEIYKQILPVPGSILELGVQWGATLSTLISLRGMLEPFNHSRHIIGFDTFEGFASISDKDSAFCEVGQYSVPSDYDNKLDYILSLHENISPLSHIKKFNIIKGDACETVPFYIENNPHLIVACAIFDFDIYKPTRVALEAIIPRLTKGSVLVFDELNCKHFPGETQAVIDTIGLNNLRLINNPNQPYATYAVFE